MQTAAHKTSKHTPSTPRRPTHTSHTTINKQTEGEANALKFSQVFHLMPVGTSFVVTNDMFRLNYG